MIPIRRARNGDLIGTLASVPTEGAINVKELGFELLLPILRDVSFAETLELNLGYRISDYNITGTVSTYRAEGLWRPIRPPALPRRLRAGDPVPQYRRAVQHPPDRPGPVRIAAERRRSVRRPVGRAPRRERRPGPHPLPRHRRAGPDHRPVPVHDGRDRLGHQRQHGARARDGRYVHRRRRAFRARRKAPGCPDCRCRRISTTSASATSSRRSRRSRRSTNATISTDRTRTTIRPIPSAS